MSVALDLEGTVTGLKISWLDISPHLPPFSLATEIVCTEMLVISYGCDCVCEKAMAHSYLMGNSWLHSAVLQSTYWRR